MIIIMMYFSRATIRLDYTVPIIQWYRTQGVEISTYMSVLVHHVHCSEIVLFRPLHCVEDQSPNNMINNKIHCKERIVG